MAIGRIDESFAEIERARELDSASTSIWADEGYILFFRGQTGRAVDILKQVEMVDPASQSAHVYLAKIYLDRGDSANYLLEARQAAELSHNAQALEICAAAREAFAAQGTQAMLHTILERQKTLLAAGRLTHYEIAKTYARIGRHEDAIVQLQAAFDNREMNILVLGQDPSLNCLHGEPHYQALRNKVKLTLQI